MKKIYLKPEIETAPLFLSACIMSATGDPQHGGYQGDPGTGRDAPRRRVF